MSAMDSSSRNAGEMLDRLTLTYNRSLSLHLSATDVYIAKRLEVIDMLLEERKKKE